MATEGGLEVTMRPIVSRCFALGTLLAGVVAGVGCSSSEPDAPPAPPSAQDPLGAALERDTGVAWLIERDATGSVFLAVPLGKARPLASGSAEDIARDFNRRYASLLGAVAADDELRVDEVRETDPGIRDVLFEQRAARSGLPVWSGGSAIHLAPDGAIVWAQPTLVQGTAALPAAATATPEQAIAAARSAISAAMPGDEGGALAHAPELGVIAAADGPHLAYAVALAGVSRAPLAFVDGVDGHVLEVRDTMSGFVATAFTAKHYLAAPLASDEKRTFWVTPFGLGGAWSMERLGVPGVVVGVQTLSYFALVGDTAQGDEITGDVASDAWDAPRSIGAGSAVDVYTNMMQVVDWYASPEKLNHRSFDGKDKGVRVFVHRDLGGDLAIYNASDDAITFEDPSSAEKAVTATPPAVAFDVAAHEFTHGVTNYAAGLGRRGAGALQKPLSEALSDIFAATIEHDQQPGPGNMLFGEALALKANKVAVRNHDAPASPDVSTPQLDALPDPNWAGWARDPYASAGVPTKAWSLMVNGGEHRGIGMPSALGWDLARDVFWRSLRGLRAHPSFWTPRALAWGQITAASWRGLPREQVDTIACAWIAVNALDLWELNTLKSLGVANSCVRPARGGGAAPTVGNECAGHGDAIICPALPGPFALQCKKGAPVYTPFCADLSTRCVRTSPDDPTTVLTPDGTITCE
jgi:Zn-dependent metalloprotease